MVDFGIAKGDFQRARGRDRVRGALAARPYMAPERLDGVERPARHSRRVQLRDELCIELLTGRTMSLSINPVSHNQAMNRQLGYIQVEGMSDAGLEDLRNLISRMCAYDRDYRPSAYDCARDLEQLVYAIDPRFRIGLEDFSRSTVLPIYEARPRIKPEEALSDSEDDFFREVTGAMSGSSGAPELTAARTRWTPYVFVGLLAFLFVLLGTLSVVKFVSSNLASNTPTQAEVAASGGLVRVMVWMPSDAQAQVGQAFLPTPGHVRVPPGPTLMQIYFTDRMLNCSFDAAEGVSVRHAVDSGREGITVNDGEWLSCTDVPAERYADGRDDPPEPAAKAGKAKSKNKAKSKSPEPSAPPPG